MWDWNTDQLPPAQTPTQIELTTLEGALISNRQPFGESEDIQPRATPARACQFLKG